jgi:NADH dehydrogenase FAD-containing subunit
MEQNTMQKSSKTPHIVVIGAGYAGLMAVSRLWGKTRGRGVKITLINASDSFVERPLLHEMATGQFPKSIPLSHFLSGTTVDFVQGHMTELDAKTQTLTLRLPGNKSQQLHYDTLVYALGSRTDRESISGLRDYAYTLDSSGERGAVALWESLKALQTGGKVMVVGSGPTGIEVAGQIAEVFPSLQTSLITKGSFGLFKTAPIQSYMRQALERLKVEILEDTAVREVEASQILTSSGKFSYDILVWAGGFRAWDFARDAGVKVGERNQILVDPYFRSISHPSIFAVGDSAQPLYSTGAPYRMGVFPAVVSGGHTADNLVRLLQGKSLKALGFSYYGQAIALGLHDAVGFNTFPNDMPIGPLFTGEFGLSLRRFFLWLLREIIVLEKQFPGALFWFGKGRGKKAEQQSLKGISPTA